MNYKVVPFKLSTQQALIDGQTQLANLKYLRTNAFKYTSEI